MLLLLHFVFGLGCVLVRWLFLPGVLLRFREFRDLLEFPQFFVIRGVAVVFSQGVHWIFVFLGSWVSDIFIC